MKTNFEPARKALRRVNPVGAILWWERLIILLFIFTGVGMFALSSPPHACAEDTDPGGNHFAACDREKIAQSLWALLDKPSQAISTAFGGMHENGAAWGREVVLDGFIVTFEAADYSHCLGLPTPDDVRWCILHAKQDHYEQVKAEAIAYLDSQGAAYETRSTSNLVYVFEIERELVCTLSLLDHIITLDAYVSWVIPAHAHILAIDPDSREIKTEYCTFWGCWGWWSTVAPDAVIHIPDFSGPAAFEDLEIGQYIYFASEDDFMITRIFVLRDMP